MSGLKFPVGSLVPLRQRSSAQNKAHKSPPGDCAAAATTNMTRRKSLSVSDISSLSLSLSLSPGGRGPRQRVPENGFCRLSKSAQSSQSSLLGGAGARESGGRSLGSSIGDLMNSGEFRPGGAGWSPRTSSPITLSMVSEAAHRSAECLQALPPTISLDEPHADTHGLVAASFAEPTLYQDTDSCRSTASRSASPGSLMDFRLEADEGGGGGVSRSLQRNTRRQEHNVTIAVGSPQHRTASPQTAAPSLWSAQQQEQQQEDKGEEEASEPQMRAGRTGLRRNTKKMSMVERTQHLALLIHDQQKRARRQVVVLPVSCPYPPPPLL